MKSLFTLLLTVLTILGCAETLPSSTKTPSKAIQDMGSQTVALVWTNPKGVVRPFCTGVWVRQDVILTAYHCVESLVNHINEGKEEGEEQQKMFGASVHYIIEKEVAGIQLEPTGIHLGTALAFAPEYDLALIKAEGNAIPAHKSATLADQSAAVGERVSIVGHPSSLYWSYTEGYVSANRLTYPMNDKTRQGPYLQISSGVWYGNSGGGCFDSDGNLIGIASFIMPGNIFKPGTPHVGFFIHLDSVKKFLKANKI